MQTPNPVSLNGANLAAVHANGATAPASGAGSAFHPADGMARPMAPMSDASRLTALASLRGQGSHLNRMRTPLRSDCAVGREIRELRRAKMMTQKDLAQMVGVTGAQLHRYETGATRIAASRLIAIADALEVGPDRLISAASFNTTSHPTPAHHGGDDLLDLIQTFSGIADPKCRSVIMTVVRMLATQQASHVPEAAVAVA
jgi:transcriptional regulator with XRE-family HTH domain